MDVVTPNRVTWRRLTLRPGWHASGGTLDDRWDAIARRDGSRWHATCQACGVIADASASTRRDAFRAAYRLAFRRAEQARLSVTI